MAEKLTSYLQVRGHSAIHVSIDGFHFNKAHRYRQGRDSALGYYEDSYHEQAFVEKVLLSSQEASPCYIPAIHDLVTDEYLDLPPISIPQDAFLISDGAYLFKPAYRKHWDVKIYLKTDFATAQSRGVVRDAESLGGEEAAIAKFKARYHEASRIYRERNRPEELADFVVDNTDFDKLVLVKDPKTIQG